MFGEVFVGAFLSFLQGFAGFLFSLSLLKVYKIGVFKVSLRFLGGSAFGVLLY